MVRVVALLSISLTAVSAFAEPFIEYHISFPNAAHHEAEIQITFSNLPDLPLEMVMSRTSPGRYAVHNFAKNVYNLHAASGDGNALEVTRPTPHEWRISGHTGEVTVTYTLFANRADGTYSGIDETHGHLNMPATFMWARGLENCPIRLSIDLGGRDWRVATQLVAEGGYTFTAPTLDYFMDSPVEASDFSLRSWEVESGGRTQSIRIALHHNGTDEDADIYAELAKRIVQEQRAIYGELPRYDYGRYTFLADFLPHVHGDAMEHRNSTVLTSRRALADDPLGNLRSVSHEFFHAWNIERIRPIDLEPFDFEAANPSGDLWFGEGFTNYYDDLIIHRVGLTSVNRYVAGLAERIETVLSAPGRAMYSAVEMSAQATFVDASASIDPTNKANAYLSYYVFGDAIALGLDLLLRSEHGTTLDAYMAEVWRVHGARERPYAHADLERILADMTEDPAFALDFFSKYVRGHEVLDYELLLAKAGILLRKKNQGAAWLGSARLQVSSGGIGIRSGTRRGEPLYIAGVDKGDTIESVNGRSMYSQSDLDDWLEEKDPGDSVSIEFKQRGLSRKATLVLAEDPSLEALLFEAAGKAVSDEVLGFRESWLGPKAEHNASGLGKTCGECRRDYPLDYEFCPFDAESLDYSVAPEEAPEPLPEAQRALNMESFRVAWETIRDQHWDPDLGGFDWDAVYEELAPRVESAATQREYINAVKSMIDRFGQSHFSIIPSAIYETMSGEGGGEASAGLDLRVIEGRALVTRVEEGGPAALAGISLGWELIEVEGRALHSVIQSTASTFAGKTMQPLASREAALGLLHGDVGAPLSLLFDDGAGMQIEKVVALEAPRGNSYRLGIFSVGHVWYKSTRVREDVGYFAFNMFMDPFTILKAFEEAIKGFQDCRGIILDVRGNGGGLPAMAMGISGWLVDEKSHTLGTMKTRDTTLNFAVNPRLGAYAGRVAVLIDGASASASEIFAAGLRDMGRATLFGTRTAGAVLPAQFMELPNGDFFYYPIADYVTMHDERLEGVGVVPEPESPHTQEALLSGRDNALETAIEWIINP